MHDRSLGSLVRSRRQRLRLKQAELAELAGCSTRFVHAVEVDKATVRLDKLIDVLRVLGLGLRVVSDTGLHSEPDGEDRSR
ncbi:MAG: helix-turn-helix transcriptional regulator [Planctomycetes bacterium]|nr:helix-turn-helix transcriptional regulator [Planctomycetota bacterium]